MPALKEALHRGEWWAPGRTPLLRTAAAAALARIGTPEAVAVLEEAARVRPARRPPRGSHAAAARASGAAEMNGLMTTPRTAARRRTAPPLCSGARPVSCTRRAIRSSRGTSTRWPPPCSRSTARARHRHRHRRRRDHRRRHADRQGGEPGRRSAGDLSRLAIERITIDRGVTAEEIATFVEAVTTLEPGPTASSAAVPVAAAHPRRARDRRADKSSGSPSTWRRSSGCTPKPCRSPRRFGTARDRRAARRHRGAHDG